MDGSTAFLIFLGVWISFALWTRHINKWSIITAVGGGFIIGCCALIFLPTKPNIPTGPISQSSDLARPENKDEITFALPAGFPELRQAALIKSVGLPVTGKYKVDDGRGIRFRKDNGEQDFNLEFRASRVNVSWMEFIDDTGKYNELNDDNNRLASKVLTVALGADLARKIFEYKKQKQSIKIHAGEATIYGSFVGSDLIINLVTISLKSTDSEKSINPHTINFTKQQFIDGWNSVSEKKIYVINFQDHVASIDIENNQRLTLAQGSGETVGSVALWFASDKRIDAAAYMINMVAIVAGVQPDLSEQQRGDIFKGLRFIGGKKDFDFSNEKTPRSYTVGKVKYSFSLIPGTAFIFLQKHQTEKGHSG